MQHFPPPPSSGPSLVKAALGKQVPGWVGRVLGAVFLVIGLLLGLCAVQALLSAATNGGAQTSFMLGAATFFGLPAVLLLLTGLRLIFQRPNKFKSLLRPLTWYLLCAIFVFFAFVSIPMIFAAPGIKFIDGVGGAIASVFLALLCYGAGSNAARRVRAKPAFQRTASPSPN